MKSLTSILSLVIVLAALTGCNGKTAEPPIPHADEVADMDPFPRQVEQAEYTIHTSISYFLEVVDANKELSHQLYPDANAFAKLLRDNNWERSLKSVSYTREAYVANPTLHNRQQVESNLKLMEEYAQQARNHLAKFRAAAIHEHKLVIE